MTTDDIIPVSPQKYNLLIGEYGGIFFGRKDEKTGQHFVRLAIYKYKELAEKLLK